MEFEQIMKLIDKVSNSNLSEFILEKDDMKLSLKAEKTVSEQVVTSQVSATEQPAAKQPQTDNLFVIKSPIVGTFYASKEENGEPLATEGMQVSRESVVGIIEAMKLMNEIPAGCQGIIQKIYVENGQLVEYGQELMAIEPV